MKLDYELSNLAEQDLENIWVYSYENWSREQANKYYQLIMKEIDNICINPNIDRQIPISKGEYRIRLVKSHVIIYKVGVRKIWVDRILHKRMDIDSRIN